MTDRLRFKLGPLVLAVSVLLGPPAVAQERFPTAEAAARALVEAVKAGQPGFVPRIFGPEGRDLLSSGDPEEDAQRLAQFNEAAAERMQVQVAGEGKATLLLGSRAWPFPAPLVRRGDSWIFDIAAGREEILNRLVGINELGAIEACHSYVAAQKEYFREDRNEDGVQEYAQRVVSQPGERDGLYWEPTSQADLSPLDERLGAAILERVRSIDEPTPYRGYVFRILKAQGPAAPGGAFGYVINGRMIAGFALVAAPAEWGKTGVMTFICNQQGRVYQKNLGPQTTEIARRMSRYNPDASWTAVE